MISPEILEEEKRMMEGESSRRDSPEKKRLRLDAEDQKMPFPYPAICAMEEEKEGQHQQQPMTVDVDPEAAIQKEDDPKVHPSKVYHFTEEKLRKLYLREEYTMDELGILDDMMDRCRTEQARLYDDKLEKQRAERKLENIQRVKTILQKLDSLTHHVRRVPNETSTNVEFFVLDPWDDKDFRHWDPDEPSLDLYYKRLVPNVKSAHIPVNPYLWNRLPEVDEQYLSLYSKLCGLVKQDEQSYILHLKWPTADRIAFFDKATQIADELKLKNLETDDFYKCIEDVFREGDIRAEHKLKSEYDMFLLECAYEKSSCSDFIPKDKTPVFESVCSFRPALQQLKFDKWMENRQHINCGKEEHQKAILALHAENLREDCSTRMRFIKFKRAWAKEHGIIAEETCQQVHGDVNETAVGA